MNIEEVRQLKERLQDNIADELTSFIRQTGLLITGVDMRRNGCHDEDGKLDVSTVVYVIDVRTEV